MKEDKKIILSGLVVIAFIAICGIIVVGYQSFDNTTKNITIDDSGSTVLLKTGDKVVLKLKDYGDGGYCWDITNIDEDVLYLIYRDHQSGSGMLGDFGYDVWAFTANNPGTLRLQLVCKQPWAGGDTAFTATFEIEVT